MMKNPFRKKPKLQPGDKVVFRLWEFGMVMFGEYVGTNDCKDWEKNCPMVKAQKDGRKYAVEAHRGGTVRLADELDIAHYKSVNYARKGQTLFAEDVGEIAPVEATSEAKPVTGIGDAAAAAVEKELEAGDE